MRALLLALPLVAAAVLAPVASAANYTDHAGTWWFWVPDVTPIEQAGIKSVLLKLNDGTGFTAFVEPAPVWTRPPTMAFECYPALGIGNLVVKGQQTTVTGDCVLHDDSARTGKFVVEFTGHDVPIYGIGVYDARPIGT